MAQRHSGPWDYKQSGKAYDFGSFNFGATGAAFGFPEVVLLSEAGIAQQEARSSLSTRGEPAPSVLPFLGTGSFGDDPSGQDEIPRGIDYYRYPEQWHKPTQLGPH